MVITFKTQEKVIQEHQDIELLQKENAFAEKVEGHANLKDKISSFYNRFINNSPKPTDDSVKIQATLSQERFIKNLLTEKGIKLNLTELFTRNSAFQARRGNFAVTQEQYLSGVNEFLEILQDASKLDSGIRFHDVNPLKVLFKDYLRHDATPKGAAESGNREHSKEIRDISKP